MSKPVVVTQRQLRWRELKKKWQTILADDPDWMERAACRSVYNRDVFFADEQRHPEQIRSARRMCLNCPVLEQCEAWIMGGGGEPTHERYFVVAAMTATERKRYYKFAVKDPAIFKAQEQARAIGQQQNAEEQKRFAEEEKRLIPIVPQRKGDKVAGRNG